MIISLHNHTKGRVSKDTLFLWEKGDYSGGKNAQEMSVIFCHVWRFVHGSWIDWNICQNREKCEFYRKKPLTKTDFRDYNGVVFERKTKGEQLSL